MRILFVTHHYYGQSDDSGPAVYSSRLDPISRIAAVSEMFTSLYRHFGPVRHGKSPASRLPDDNTEERLLEIVVLQVPGKGILEQTRIDPSQYTLEIWDGPPMLLGFETQRVLRDRLGEFDYYCVIEDDMVIHDPMFFEKISWFEEKIGTEAVLLPTRYEMSKSGMFALVSAWPEISLEYMKNLGMRRDGQRIKLSENWMGHQQSFLLPANPHVGGYFLSDTQLRHWVEQPTFYDRDASFVGPLESAMCLSLGRSFDVYQPSEPDPFFLSIEHWGTRYARAYEPPDQRYGDSPLLELAHAGLAGMETVAEQSKLDEIESLFNEGAHQFNALVHERDRILSELSSLKRSRSKLLRQLAKTTIRKFSRH